MAQPESGDGFSDLRTTWMRSKVLLSTKIRDNKWVEMANDENHMFVSEKSKYYPDRPF